MLTDQEAKKSHIDKKIDDRNMNRKKDMRT